MSESGSSTGPVATALHRAAGWFGERGLVQRLSISVVALALVALVVAGVAFPGSKAGALLGVLLSESTLGATLRLSVPIALAAVGGIFSEKAGVINIGLEGLLIISAFSAIWMTDVTGSLALGVLGGVLASTLLAALFAVVCIKYRADQIIAGLAVWLIALGLAPFASSVIYGSTNTDSVQTVQTVTQMGIPVLSDALTATIPGTGTSLAGLPFLGALFDATPFVYLMFLVVALSWYVLNRTTFGRWVRASGENPKALDTAGVNVHRVRYAAVVLSGVLAGIGGAALSLSIGQFTGSGPTMVNGKGFIAIVAFLFGNYNPIGALLSTMLFAGLDAVQLTLQALDVFDVPRPLVRTIPYVTVIIVLALFGRTRVPEASGEHYDTGEDR
ncbi:ABC transporter permease [Halarchaeum grantii]|uniref:ABC transporter permease n=1 Tax=Halarchaeum grantii TaxID=1193105 RepID=A0A830ERA6_9EURY|nr:ABC transporter permease [Halarchaeum grantii]GGL22347.1 ABC transporter permease [Halarchaeum grantii]